MAGMKTLSIEFDETGIIFEAHPAAFTYKLILDEIIGFCRKFSSNYRFEK